MKQTNPHSPISKADKAMVQLYVDEPKLTKTDAWKLTHKTKTTNKGSVYQQAAHSFRTPQVKMELAKYSTMVEDAIIGTVDDWKKEDSPRKREIAMNSAHYIHDKIHGKARQQIEMTTQSLVLNIDLTGSSEDNDSQPLPPIPTPV